MEQLSTSDVEVLVRLLAHACDPTINKSVAWRKRTLLEGLAELVDADIWLWNTAAIRPGVLEDVVATSVIDGGWRDDRERDHVLEVLSDPEFNRHTMSRLHETVSAERCLTATIETLVAPEQWQHVAKTWYATGLRHALLSVYPVGGGVISAMGLHRRDGKPNFGERERDLVHIVFKQVDWLHRYGTNIPVAQRAIQLSPRERQVLIYVLGGDSRKQIAGRLGISEHTVSDYLKQLHKHFGVKSRAELLAHFIAGGQS